MTQRDTGNGSGEFKVHTQDMGGWVRVFTDPGAFTPADLPTYLSHALTGWFRQRPMMTFGQARRSFASFNPGDSLDFLGDAIHKCNIHLPTDMSTHPVT